MKLQKVSNLHFEVSTYVSIFVEHKKKNYG
jgi:hypothetical protein